MENGSKIVIALVVISLWILGTIVTYLYYFQDDDNDEEEDEDEINYVTFQELEDDLGSDGKYRSYEEGDTIWVKDVISNIKYSQHEFGNGTLMSFMMRDGHEMGMNWQGGNLTGKFKVEDEVIMSFRLKYVEPSDRFVNGIVLEDWTIEKVQVI